MKRLFSVLFLASSLLTTFQLQYMVLNIAGLLTMVLFFISITCAVSTQAGFLRNLIPRWWHYPILSAGISIAVFASNQCGNAILYNQSVWFPSNFVDVAHISVFFVYLVIVCQAWIAMWLWPSMSGLRQQYVELRLKYDILLADFNALKDQKK